MFSLQLIAIVLTIDINKAKSSEWRSVFLNQEQFTNANVTEWEMNLPEAFSYSWIKKNLISFKRRLCSAKQNCPNENILKIIYREIGQKLIGLYRFSTKRNRKICDRYMQIAKAESDNQF